MIMQHTPEIFAQYAHYYNLLYRDKDYEAESLYIASLIRKLHPQAHFVLELGSGTGIHASKLATKGFNVHGIERSSEMLNQSLELAKTVNQKAVATCLSFSHGDIRNARLTDRFDVVVSLFHVISYQTSNADVVAAFETARHHLTPGGIFIFDVWYGPAVLTQRPEVRIKRISDEKIEVTRLAEPTLHPNENRVDVCYHMFVRDRETKNVTELRETHFMRFFFQPEIEFLAHTSRFTIQNAEEWQTAKPIGVDTWSACFCLQAL